MKRKVNNLLSGLLISGLISCSFFCENITVKALKRLEGYIFTADNGFIYTENNELVLGAESLAVFIREDSSSFIGFTSNCRVTEVDIDPTTKEEMFELMEKHYNNKYSGFFIVKKPDGYIAFMLKRTMNSYSLCQKKYVPCDPDIKYIIDVSKGEIRDYKTNNILQKRSTEQKTYYHVGPWDDNEYYPTLFATDGILYLDTWHKFSLAQKGDVDKNDIVDLTDLSYLSLLLLGDYSIDQNDNPLADVNFDNQINIADLASLKEIICHG